jgi:hypothetical protein
MRAVAAAGRRDLQAGFTILASQPIPGREGRITVWVAPMEALLDAAGA